MKYSVIIKILLLAQCVSFASSTARFYLGASFFRSSSREGFLAEVMPTSNCQNLYSEAMSRAGYMETDDCIIVFKGPNCNSDHIRLSPGNYNLYNVKQFPNLRFYHIIGSFQKCTEHYGGTKTNVRFVLRNKSSWEVKDLRERVSVAGFAEYPVQFWNHGNCIEIQAQSSNPIYNGIIRVEGGRSPFTYFTQVVAGKGDFGVRFMYISPCKVKENCAPRMIATVTGVNVSLPSNGVTSKTADLAMGATSTFINNGWATVSQEYTASKTITEISEVTLIRSATKMSSWSIEAGVEIEFGGGIPLLGISKTKVSLSAAYSGQSSTTVGDTKRVYHEVKTMFSVNQKIEIEPCTKYKVDSMVRMMEDFPLDYTVTYETKGFYCSNPMRAYQIRAQLGNLMDMKDKDNQTVIVTEKGTMLLTFRIESLIDGKGEIIKTCLLDSKKASSKILMAKMQNVTT